MFNETVINKVYVQQGDHVLEDKEFVKQITDDGIHIVGRDGKRKINIHHTLAKKWSGTAHNGKRRQIRAKSRRHRGRSFRHSRRHRHKH